MGKAVADAITASEHVAAGMQGVAECGGTGISGEVPSRFDPY